jgi:4-amino-4-deoxy-L-arabinose transferase-like glycosyltransferase
VDEPVAGAERDTGRRRWLALALLAPIALSFLLVDLGGWSLWGDEALYGGVAIDTAAAGRLLPMVIDDDDYVSKPIGGFLFLRAAFALWGPTEIAARLPSVAAALATVLLVAHAGARWFGAGQGFLAGLFLVTAPRALNFHGFRSGTFDALLVLATSAVLVLWIESVRRGSRGRWLAHTFEPQPPEENTRFVPSAVSTKVPVDV